MQAKIIVLVEDNPDDAFLTKRALASANVANEVLVLADGAEALDYFFERGAYATGRKWPPQLVLLDLKMPRVDGMEVLRQLRADERTRWLPIVVLTSSREDPDLRQAYDLGVNSYVVKPVDFAQFSEAVQKLGLYWLLLNQPPPPPQGGGS